MLEGKPKNLEFQEMLSSPHWKIEMSKNKTKMLKKGTKRNGEPKKKKEMKEGTTKNDLSCNDKNDPWSDHPEIQFGPIYPLFRNHKPWPTLRT